jgi:YVTN family beta-propeller protein
MRSKLARTVLLLIALTPAALPQARQRPYIAVVEKVAGKVGFFTEDGQLLREVPVGAFPHEAVLARDGRLFVTCNGVLWMTEDGMGGNTIAVVDVRAMRKIDEIDLGKFHRPHGIALVPGSNRLLATTERPSGLVLVDPAQRKVVRDYDVKGKSPHMVMPSREGAWAFASNTDSSAVAAIRLESGETTVIPTAAQPQGMALSPSGDRLYVVNMEGNRITIIDTRRRSVMGTIATGKGPARIAITPDGKTLVYNLQFEPAVGFADIASGKETGMVPVSGRPLSLTMTADGKRAFAGIQDQDKIYFISVAERKAERTIALPKGSGPDPAIPLEGLR